ncbi:hypothetical protein DMH18_26010 [Streptomyces sp. WAC 06783]|uniref:hypothetical protein n=1 Tax=Streptomyces sp. WAC 06783 TaxID=2203211 RepID=UPI000F745C56|nr:hypothetical protein [Streptomyces sp. WAC 06783]RSO06913.1 hypothetical protein DMH18_26010 [Streptomyces sp. WAC 06783]
MTTPSGPPATSIRAHSPVGATGRRGAPAASPLAYTAFCQLHHRAYLHHAQLRTGDALLAEQAVAAALAELRARWPAVLSSACPAAGAWAILTQTLSAYGSPDSPQGDAIEGRTADAVRLHRERGLPLEQVAEAVGIEPSLLRASLRLTGPAARRPQRLRTSGARKPGAQHEERNPFLPTR